MTPIHRLAVLMRIPIRIEDDTRVGRGEVDSQPSRASAQEKHKVSVVAVVARSSLPCGLFGVENIHLALPFVNVGGAVDAAILPAAVEQVILDDVEEGSHLAENEDLVFVPVQPLQHAIQQGKLSARANEELGMRAAHVRPRDGIDGLAEHERVVAILAVIHLLVRLAQRPRAFYTLVEEYVPQHALFDHFGVSFLQFGHARVDDHFLFGGHVRQHVHFDATEQERSEDVVELADRRILPFGNEDVLLGGGTLRLLTDVAKAEPRLEDAQIVEDGGIDKVKKTPQLVQVVLDGSTAQKQSVGGFDAFQGLNKRASMILQTLSLIHNQVGVLSNLVQSLLVPNRHLVTRDNNGKVWVLFELCIQRSGEHGISLLRSAVESYHWERGKPFVEFAYPVGKRGERYDDDEWAGHVHCAKMRDEGDDLNCFTQSHLIGQNPTNPILIQTHQPPHPLQLIIFQFTPRRQILGLNEDRFPLRSLGGIVFFRCSLQIGFAVGGFAVVALFAFSLLFGVGRSTLFRALFLATSSNCVGGLGLHGHLEFVNVRGDEVGVFFGTAQEEVELVIPCMHPMLIRRILLLLLLRLLFLCLLLMTLLALRLAIVHAHLSFLQCLLQ
mmetsp:Transcript_24470/g.52910  ORF Transcript_24470/g.52910 Transcript_24470/m.52910 type:complete len:611 (+) Transcript_24470:546-2378(+)